LVCTQAKQSKNQILISGATFKEIEKEGFNLHPHGNYLLKGLKKEIPIYEVPWYEGQEPIEIANQRKEGEKKMEEKPEGKKVNQKINVTGSQNVTKFIEEMFLKKRGRS